MNQSWQLENNHTVGYSWKKKMNWNKLEVIASPDSFELKTGSEEEFITEHYWGYSKINENKTGEYRVEHPRWAMYPVEQYNINCDFSECYGDDFRFLNGAMPASVFLAEGSPISVYGKKIL